MKSWCIFNYSSFGIILVREYGNEIETHSHQLELLMVGWRLSKALVTNTKWNIVEELKW